MLNIDFDPLPRFSTERLVLRPLKADDDNALLALRSDDRVNEFIHRQKMQSIEEAQAMITKLNNGITDNKWGYWAVALKSDPTLIGTVCLFNIIKEDSRAEIGYELIPGEQGKGLVQEAVSKIIEYTFGSLRVKTIIAWIKTGNERSVKLVEKLGFTRDQEAELKSEEARAMGMMIYSLNSESWKSS
jgi:ribosomal-protein-alanine N-acetyltransferase